LLCGLRDLVDMSFDGFPVRAGEPAGVLEAVHGARRVWLDQLASADRHLLAGQEVVGRQDRGLAARRNSTTRSSLRLLREILLRPDRAISISSFSAACSSCSAL
jgi:hypothetical protein